MSFTSPPARSSRSGSPSRCARGALRRTAPVGRGWPRARSAIFSALHPCPPLSNPHDLRPRSRWLHLTPPRVAVFHPARDTDTAKLGGGPIVVRDSLLSEEVQSILHELGFRIGADGWEKITLRFLGNAPAFEQALKAIGQPATPKGAVAAEIEAQYWPAKILGAGMSTWAVAIQSGWATELFETTFADERLFRPKRELILSRENVYYSAATQSGMEGATGRLLWYVSKYPDQAGSQSIRACSRLLEVRRGPAKVLFGEFRRLGVFEWRDILSMAGGDPTKEIIALRFADTELFEQPFPGAQAKALGIRNNFTSPVKVPETAFTEIYRHGMNLPVQT